jgi:hypothetical protein
MLECVLVARMRGGGNGSPGHSIPTAPIDLPSDVISNLPHPQSVTPFPLPPPFLDPSPLSPQGPTLPIDVPSDVISNNFDLWMQEVHTKSHTHTHINTHTQVDTHTNTPLIAHTHTHKHTHTNTSTHTHKCRHTHKHNKSYFFSCHCKKQTRYAHELTRPLASSKPN